MTRAGQQTATPPTGSPTPARPPNEPDEAAAEAERSAGRIAGLLREPDGLRTVYQPVLDLHTGRVAGYEALTRLAERPARSPQPWFTAAARAGLAGQFEAAALRSSLSARADLAADQFLAVNVDPAALAQPAVTDLLLSHDLHGLVIELGDLEPVLSRDDRGVALARLRAAGALLAVDVREAGAGELRRIVTARPDLMILDGALVAGVHADPVLQRVGRLVVGLADDLGATTLAEGLEDLDDARHLQHLGVGLGQGWLFGRARPGLRSGSPEVAAWVSACWQEAVATGRIGSLTVELPGWVPEFDGAGCLVAVTTPAGRRLPASALIRLGDTLEPAVAARRALAADAARQAIGVAALSCDDGRFAGLLPLDRLLRRALQETPSRATDERIDAAASAAPGWVNARHAPDRPGRPAGLSTRALPESRCVP